MDKENSNSIQFKLPLDTLPDRLDKVLAKLIPEHSRARLQSWIESGHVYVNGVPGKIRTRVGPASHIQVWPQPAPEDLSFTPEPVNFDVLAESQDWIVIDKPAGLVTHPGAGNWHGTLLNGLLYRYPELSKVARAGIVHRLDKDTSGALVVARNEQAQTSLVRQLQAHTVKRRYCAIVLGYMQGQGSIDMPIGRDPHVQVRMTTQHPTAPKHALTNYMVKASGLYQGTPVSQVICQLETGRTHQIRVHLAQMKHPLVGDAVYGGKLLGLAQRQMLHAFELGFTDPGSGAELNFESALAADIQAVIADIVWVDPKKA